MYAQRAQSHIYIILMRLQVTFASALLSFLNPYIRMGGTELVHNLFVECRLGGKNTHSSVCVLDPPTQAASVIGAFLIALLLKGALTIITFGIKAPASIVILTLGHGSKSVVACNGAPR